MPKDSQSSYPKKYWWLILIVVPLIIALIQYQPWKTGGGLTGAAGGVQGNQFLGPAIVGNVSVVVNEASKAGAVLEPALIDRLKEAAGLSKAGQHEAAVAKIEEVRGSSSQLAALPSLLNNLGLEYLAAGKADRARQAFEGALEKDATNKAALAGLAQLPETRLKGLKVINFSGERLVSVNAGGWASHIADGNPATGWMTADGKFPQSVVLELPVECMIGELGFNNAAHWEADGSAKNVEISISAHSATSGFEIAATAVLVQGEIGQGIRLNPARRGRWIKLRILSNYGNTDHTELGDVEAIGRPRAE
jgi:tetratricopeptide (TPR) repeat protein